MALRTLFRAQKWGISVQYQKIRIFGKWPLWSVFTFYWYLTSCKKSKKYYLNFWSYGTAHLFQAQNWGIFVQYRQMKIFGKWPLWSVFTFYWYLTSCKKSKRNYLNFWSYGTAHLFGDQKWCILVQWGQIRIFCKWPLWSVFTLYWYLTSCKKSKR